MTSTDRDEEDLKRFVRDAERSDTISAVRAGQRWNERSLQQLQQMESDIASAKAQLRRCEKDIADANNEIAKAQREISLAGQSIPAAASETVISAASAVVSFLQRPAIMAEVTRQMAELGCPPEWAQSQAAIKEATASLELIKGRAEQLLERYRTAHDLVRETRIGYNRLLEKSTSLRKDQTAFTARLVHIEEFVTEGEAEAIATVTNLQSENGDLKLKLSKATKRNFRMAAKLRASRSKLTRARLSSASLVADLTAGYEDELITSEDQRLCMLAYSLEEQHKRKLSQDRAQQLHDTLGEVRQKCSQWRLAFLQTCDLWNEVSHVHEVNDSLRSQMQGLELSADHRVAKLEADQADLVSRLVATEDEAKLNYELFATIAEQKQQAELAWKRKHDEVEENAAREARQLQNELTIVRGGSQRFLDLVSKLYDCELDREPIIQFRDLLGDGPLADASTAWLNAIPDMVCPSSANFSDLFNTYASGASFTLDDVGSWVSKFQGTNVDKDIVAIMMATIQKRGIPTSEERWVVILRMLEFFKRSDVPWLTIRRLLQPMKAALPTRGFVAGLADWLMHDGDYTSKIMANPGLTLGGISWIVVGGNFLALKQNTLRFVWRPNAGWEIRGDRLLWFWKVNGETLMQDWASVDDKEAFQGFLPRPRQHLKGGVATGQVFVDDGN